MAKGKNTAGMFSRSGTTSLLGKLDDRMEAFRIEGIVKARFAVIAAKHGKTSQEYLRFILQVITFGPDEVLSLHRKEVDAVVRMLAGKDGNEG